MKCPYCLSVATDVLESRVTEGGSALRRRRQCITCHKRFTTYERVEGIEVMVLKKDGSEERFEREKIKKGIMKATWRRPISVEQVEKILDEVECSIRSKGLTHIKSWEVGKLVLSKLEAIDPLACLLFSSVYQGFETLEEFIAEIERLKGIINTRKEVGV